MGDRSVQTKLKPALELLKQGDLERSYEVLEQLLEDDLENCQVLSALRGVGFWRDRLSYALKQQNDFFRGKYIISQWKPFLEYMEKLEACNDQVLAAFKYSAFSKALEIYKGLLHSSGGIHTAEIYRKTGLCYKALGDYETAIECLRYAASLNDTSAAILAELADAYAFSGEIRYAKVFFREAFFINPSEVEFCFLESELIRGLVSRVEAAGYKTNDLAEWVPVYGALDGVFNVKRELKAIEFGKLKQGIYMLENELRSKNPVHKELIVPRLLNYYFWLIDHYINTNGEKTKIDEIRLRIKLIHEEIYDRYIR